MLRSIFPVATGLFCVRLISVSRPEDLYRDIKTPFKLEVCHSIDFPYCNLVSSSITHPFSRPSFLVVPKLLLQHLFCLNKRFHVIEVNVATKTILSRKIFFLQFSIMSQRKLSCSQLSCICFSHSLLRPVVFCLDLAQLSTIILWCCNTGNVVSTRFLW